MPSHISMQTNDWIVFFLLYRLHTFDKMSASDALSELDVRQLLLDNELAYNDFKQQIAVN